MKTLPKFLKIAKIFKALVDKYNQVTQRHCERTATEYDNCVILQP